MTTYDLETSFTGLSLGTDGTTSDFPSYVFCDTEAHTKSLVDHVAAFLASERSNYTIYLDCEGRDLGRLGGKLGLVQLGIENEVYLVDIITYPEALDSLKPIIENPRLEKVVWDGRNDYCELWHGHGIELRSPLDLQLVRVYEACNGRSGSQGFIMLQGMGKVFQSKGSVVRESGINQTRFEEVRERIKEKHNRDDTDFWVSRPLGKEEREYAAFDILQLRALYKSYQLRIAQLPHIMEESIRYAEIYKNERRGSLWFIEHGILPQEILHPQWSTGQRSTETKKCGACARILHQCSFPRSFLRWQKGQLCYTCTRATMWRRF